MIYRNIIKPILDWLIALLFIIIFSPVWSFFLGLVWAIQRGPLFYVQIRSGRHMKSFKLYKIRTLEISQSSNLSLSNRSYTRLGKWMRKTGLDELPQLINILRGDMSFIGPRPMPEAYKDKYNHKQKMRFNCLPGITGWAQVRGRNDMTWEKRFALDNDYVRKISLLLDLQILLLTINQIVSKEIREEMPVFTGTKMA